MEKIKNAKILTTEIIPTESHTVIGEVVEPTAIVIVTDSLVAVTERAEDVLNLLQNQKCYEKMTIAKVNSLSEALAIQQSYLGAKAIIAQIGQPTMSIPEAAIGANMQAVPKVSEEEKGKLLTRLLAK